MRKPIVEIIGFTTLVVLIALSFVPELRQWFKDLRPTVTVDESFEGSIETTPPSDQELMEGALTKWVYDHSTRISRSTAKEIVVECLKTRKPLLLLAVIEVESNFIPSATSSKGALGLTQVRFSVHGQNLIKMGVIKESRDLYDIGPSVRAGQIILNDYLNQAKGNIAKALESYLGGQDGKYLQRILTNTAELYILVSDLKQK